jgi:hypothetical protein
MKRPLVLLLVVAGCSRPPAESNANLVDSTVLTVCGTPADTLPYTKVDFGPARTTPMAQGLHARELIQSADDWAQRWRVIGDSTPAPQLNFQDSILVIVASPMLDSGGSAEIEAVRQCIGTKDIVVPVRVHKAATAPKQPERSIRGIQIAKSVWKMNPITFVDMPALTATAK